MKRSGVEDGPIPFGAPSQSSASRPFGANPNPPRASVAAEQDDFFASMGLGSSPAVPSQQHQYQPGRPSGIPTSTAYSRQPQQHRSSTGRGSVTSDDLPDASSLFSPPAPARSSAIASPTRSTTSSSSSANAQFDSFPPPKAYPSTAPQQPSVSQQQSPSSPPGPRRSTAAGQNPYAAARLARANRSREPTIDAAASVFTNPSGATSASVSRTSSRAEVMGASSTNFFDAFGMSADDRKDAGGALSPPPLNTVRSSKVLDVLGIGKADPIEQRKLDEQKRAEEQRRADEARKAEEARVAEEMRRAKQAKRLEEIKRAEEQKRADELKRIEEQRRVEELERIAEQQRLAELKRTEELKRAEELKKVEEARRAEEMRAAEEQRRIAEEQRAAEERRKLLEAQKVADEQRRLAEEQRVAEEKRAAAEQRRLAEAERAAEEQRRIAEEARRAEEIQRAEEERRIAEEARRAEEIKRAEAARVAEEERRAYEQRVAEEERMAEERRVQEQRRAAEERRVADELKHAQAAMRAPPPMMAPPTQHNESSMPKPMPAGPPDNVPPPPTSGWVAEPAKARHVGRTRKTTPIPQGYTMGQDDFFNNVRESEASGTEVPAIVPSLIAETATTSSMTDLSTPTVINPFGAVEGGGGMHEDVSFSANISHTDILTSEPADTVSAQSASDEPATHHRGGDMSFESSGNDGADASLSGFVDVDTNPRRYGLFSSVVESSTPHHQIHPNEHQHNDHPPVEPINFGSHGVEADELDDLVFGAAPLPPPTTYKGYAIAQPTEPAEMDGVGVFAGGDDFAWQVGGHHHEHPEPVSPSRHQATLHDDVAEVPPRVDPAWQAADGAAQGQFAMEATSPSAMNGAAGIHDNASYGHHHGGFDYHQSGPFDQIQQQQHGEPEDAGALFGGSANKSGHYDPFSAASEGSAAFFDQTAAVAPAPPVHDYQPTSWNGEQPWQAQSQNGGEQGCGEEGGWPDETVDPQQQGAGVAPPQQAIQDDDTKTIAPRVVPAWQAPDGAARAEFTVDNTSPAVTNGAVGTYGNAAYGHHQGGLDNQQSGPFNQIHQQHLGEVEDAGALFGGPANQSGHYDVFPTASADGYRNDAYDYHQEAVEQRQDHQGGPFDQVHQQYGGEPVIAGASLDATANQSAHYDVFPVASTDNYQNAAYDHHQGNVEQHHYQGGPFDQVHQQHVGEPEDAGAAFGGTANQMGHYDVFPSGSADGYQHAPYGYNQGNGEQYHQGGPPPATQGLTALATPSNARGVGSLNSFVPPPPLHAFAPPPASNDPPMIAPPPQPVTAPPTSQRPSSSAAFTSAEYGAPPMDAFALPSKAITSPPTAQVQPLSAPPLPAHQPQADQYGADQYSTSPYPTDTYQAQEYQTEQYSGHGWNNQYESGNDFAMGADGGDQVFNTAAHYEAPPVDANTELSRRASETSNHDGVSCPSCMKRNSLDSRFCNNCGTRIPERAPEVLAPPPVPIKDAAPLTQSLASAYPGPPRQNVWRHSAAPPMEKTTSGSRGAMPVVQQQPAFVDPLSRRGHAIGIFGPGGTLITTFPSRQQRLVKDVRGASVMVEKTVPGRISVMSVAAAIKEVGEGVKLPGPLVGGAKAFKKKEVVKFTDDFISEAKEKLEHARSTATGEQGLADKLKAEDYLVLWRLMKLLVEKDGILLGAKGDEVVKLLREFVTPAPSMAPVDEILAALLTGDKNEACNVATARHMWSHALILAGVLSPERYKETVVAFSRSELSSTRASIVPPETGVDRPALRVLYAMFSGVGGSSVREQFPGPEDFSADSAHYAPIESISRWKETLVLMLANRKPGIEFVIYALGDQLRSYGYTFSAQICYLLAANENTVTGPDNEVGRVVLFGSDHRLNPNFTNDVKALNMTEVYEYGLTLASGIGGGVLPHLQSYKLLYANHLVDAGNIVLASQYCVAMHAIVTSYKKGSTYFHQRFAQTLNVLKDTIAAKSVQGGAPDGKEGGSWFSKVARLDTITSALDRGIVNLINSTIGDTPPKSPATGAGMIRSTSQGAASVVGSILGLSTPAPPAMTHSNSTPAPILSSGVPDMSKSMSTPNHATMMDDSVNFVTAGSLQTNPADQINNAYDSSYAGYDYGAYGSGNYDDGSGNGYAPGNPAFGAYDDGYGSNEATGNNSYPDANGVVAEPYAYEQPENSYGQHYGESYGQYDAGGQYNGEDQYQSNDHTYGNDQEPDGRYGSEQPDGQPYEHYRSDDPYNGGSQHGAIDQYGAQRRSSFGQQGPSYGQSFEPQLGAGFSQQQRPGSQQSVNPPVNDFYGRGNRDDVDDDLGLGNKSLKKKPDTAMPEGAEPKPEEPQSGSKPDTPSNSARSSVWSVFGLFGGRRKSDDKGAADSPPGAKKGKATPVDLGNKLTLVYDKELKRYVMPDGKPPVEDAKPPPPPPMATSFSAPVSRNSTPPQFQSPGGPPARPASTVPSMLSGPSADRTFSQPGVGGPSSAGPGAGPSFGAALGGRAGGPAARRGARNRYVDVMKSEGSVTPTSSTGSVRSFLPPAAANSGVAMMMPAPAPELPDEALAGGPVLGDHGGRWSDDAPIGRSS
ncbi:Protein transport protein Sec16B, partial [Irineochytrium annulatum]